MIVYVVRYMHVNESGEATSGAIRTSVFTTYDHAYRFATLPVVHVIRDENTHAQFVAVLLDSETGI